VRARFVTKGGAVWRMPLGQMCWCYRSKRHAIDEKSVPLSENSSPPLMSQAVNEPGESEYGVCLMKTVFHQYAKAVFSLKDYLHKEIQGDTKKRSSPKLE